MHQIGTSSSLLNLMEKKEMRICLQAPMQILTPLSCRFDHINRGTERQEKSKNSDAVAGAAADRHPFECTTLESVHDLKLSKNGAHQSITV
mmetsp:Transcript_22119/g.54144  ORF Transcript_22119/g.54144 Transcript_22119/m.54144 type:complete len:91 (+) Transcript_22119:1786-2058(+)